LYGKDTTVNSKVRINSNNELNLEHYGSKATKKKMGFQRNGRFICDAQILFFCSFFFLFFVFCMDDLKLVDVALTLGADIDVNVSYATHVANDKLLTSTAK